MLCIPFNNGIWTLRNGYLDQCIYSNLTNITSNEIVDIKVFCVQHAKLIYYILLLDSLGYIHFIGGGLSHSYTSISNIIKILTINGMFIILSNTGILYQLEIFFDRIHRVNCKELYRNTICFRFINLIKYLERKGYLYINPNITIYCKFNSYLECLYAYITYTIQLKIFDIDYLYAFLNYNIQSDSIYLRCGGGVVSGRSISSIRDIINSNNISSIQNIINSNNIRNSIRNSISNIKIYKNKLKYTKISIISLKVTDMFILKENQTEKLYYCKGNYLYEYPKVLLHSNIKFIGYSYNNYYYIQGASIFSKLGIVNLNVGNICNLETIKTVIQFNDFIFVLSSTCILYKIKNRIVKSLTSVINCFVCQEPFQGIICFIDDKYLFYDFDLNLVEYITVNFYKFHYDIVYHQINENSNLLKTPEIKILYSYPNP